MSRDDRRRRRTTSRWTRYAITFAAAGALLGACGGNTPASEGARSAESSDTEIGIEGLAFEPSTLEVDAGTTVTWRNGDSVAHTVTSGVQGEQGAPGVSEDKAAKRDGLFDENLQEEGASFSFTFDEPGTYSYFCDIHRQMVGEVVVK